MPEEANTFYTTYCYNHTSSLFSLPLLNCHATDALLLSALSERGRAEAAYLANPCGTISRQTVKHGFWKYCGLDRIIAFMLLLVSSCCQGELLKSPCLLFPPCLPPPSPPQACIATPWTPIRPEVGSMTAVSGGWCHSVPAGMTLLGVSVFKY